MPLPAETLSLSTPVQEVGNHYVDKLISNNKKPNKQGVNFPKLCNKWNFLLQSDTEEKMEVTPVNHSKVGILLWGHVWWCHQEDSQWTGIPHSYFHNFLPS